MLIATFVPFSSYAANEQQTSGSCGDNATFELKDGVLTISGTGEITSYPWREYFGETTNIKKVIINEGITVIGQYSFIQCTNLKEAILPQSLTDIEESAFKECKKLEKIDLPKNIQYIRKFAFSECVSLKKIVLPKSLRRICSSAFSYCKAMKGTLFIPKDLKIEMYSFQYCEGLEEVMFEDGFTDDNLYTGGTCYTFNHCTNVRKVFIPGSLKTVPLGLFINCSSLSDVTLSEGVESVGGFMNCSSLEKVVLPKSMKYIDSFFGCRNLKTLKIQSRIKAVNMNAFTNCTSLSIEFPYGVDSINTRHAMGYIQEYDETDKIVYTPIKNFKVYGKKCKALTEYCKNNGFTFVDMYDIKNAGVTGLTSKAYTGKAIKPDITVKLAGTTLKKDTDYTVKYSNNTKVGKAKITLTGIGKYKGTLEKTFKINPKPTELTKLTAGSKSFKAYWKKNTTQTSGYQIQYSTYKDLKNAKTVTITSYKTGAKTIKSLKAKKKYFVRIRTYKTVNKTKYYSKWSEAKSIKTK